MSKRSTRATSRLRKSPPVPVGFLGVAERGTTTATLLGSYTDYARAFGTYYADPTTNQQYYLAFAVEGFFTNGGQRCFVQAVRSSAAVPSTHDAGT